MAVPRCVRRAAAEPETHSWALGPMVRWPAVFEGGAAMEVLTSMSDEMNYGSPLLPNHIQINYMSSYGHAGDGTPPTTSADTRAPPTPP